MLLGMYVVEPDEPSNELSGIVFTRVHSRGNAGRGLQWTLTALSAQTPSPIDVTMQDCTVDGGGMVGVSISGTTKGLPAGGHLTLLGLQTRNTGGAGVLVENKPAGLQVNVVNSTIFNVSVAAPASVWIEGRNVICSGVNFSNVTVADFAHRPALLMIPQVQDVTGELRVINPTGCVPSKVTGASNSLKVECEERAD